ncbi:MAG TPA: AMP-binding protein, partial [Prolixibacteraceae bacterium]|nr:AMP-binding protein [Prolixibacteraceae bacterium]
MEMANHEVKRTFDLLHRYAALYADKTDAIGGFDGKQCFAFSTKEYIDNTNWVSLGLLALGIKKGDKVATVSTNRPEWNFFDLGLAQIGAVHVPIYPTISIEDYKYIIEHCEAKLVILGDHKLHQKIGPLVDEIEPLNYIYSFDEIEGVKNWQEILNAGKASKETEQLDAIKESISETDLATIIYTSGTTGVPKGVMLSHLNLVSNFKQ